MEVSWREIHRTNTPFKAWLSPWTNHSGPHWRPEVGALMPSRTAAPQGSVSVPRSPDSAVARAPRALGSLAAGLKIGHNRLA